MYVLKKVFAMTPYPSTLACSLGPIGGGAHCQVYEQSVATLSGTVPNAGVFTLSLKSLDLNAVNTSATGVPNFVYTPARSLLKAPPSTAPPLASCRPAIVPVSQAAS